MDALTVARTNGNLIPEVAWACADMAGIPYWAILSFLEMESGGGANVFGHDGGWYSGAGTVTRAKYAAYKAGRDQHNAQGVGPMQLTWPPYQDRADAAGGCWIPWVNTLIGCQILAEFIDAGDTWHEAARRWNGSDNYADQMDVLFVRWQTLLHDATPPGGTMLGSRLVQYRGEFYADGTPKLITLRIEQAMAKLEAKLGYKPESLDLAQGCHHDGSLSGGTHSKADVFDLSYAEADKKAQALIDLGVIPFVRDYNWDGAGGLAHVHCIIVGSPGLAPQAAAQIPDWRAHKNGLASHGPYTGHPWDGAIRDFAYDPHWTRNPKPPPPPPHGPEFPDVDEAIAALGALHVHTWAVHTDALTKAKKHPLVLPFAAAATDLETAAPLVKKARDGLITWKKAQGG
jgi:hypothetical protein